MRPSCSLHRKLPQNPVPSHNIGFPDSSHVSSSDFKCPNDLQPLHFSAPLTDGLQPVALWAPLPLAQPNPSSPWNSSSILAMTSVPVGCGDRDFGAAPGLGGHWLVEGLVGTSCWWGYRVGDGSIMLVGASFWWGHHTGGGIMFMAASF